MAMYLSKEFALKLKEMGFRRTYYEDEVAPFDYYQLDDEEWVLGGRILPEGNILANPDVYQKGTWLPSLNDLLYWLTDNDYAVMMETKERARGFKVVVTDRDGNNFVGKGGTAEYALFDVIVKILNTK
jgi:hypothetical protein